jgi:hypothetical protein
MNIAEKVRNYILEANNSDLSSEETETILDKILELGDWEEIRNGLLSILYENDQILWNQTILYIYYFQGRGYKYEPPKTIALLYNCLGLSDELDDNLIWTITKDIRSVSYLSDYDPYKDPAVLEEMKNIEKLRSRV